MDSVLVRGGRIRAGKIEILDWISGVLAGTIVSELSHQAQLEVQLDHFGIFSAKKGYAHVDVVV